MTAKIVDGKGKYLIPGLWDMHVHTWDYESTYPLYIANGVTGVRDMFGPPDANKFRAQLATKATIAPHFYFATPLLTDTRPCGLSRLRLRLPIRPRPWSMTRSAGVLTSSKCTVGFHVTLTSQFWPRVLALEFLSRGTYLFKLRRGRLPMPNRRVLSTCTV